MFEEGEKEEKKLEVFVILEDIIELVYLLLIFFKMRVFLRVYLLKKSFYLLEKDDVREIK